MSGEPLTRERILVAAEEALRRFGPDKATVVDVARALAVSHGSVYRHFPSKQALRESVAERWLARVSDPLAAIVAERGPAPRRLRRWFAQLLALKRRKVLEDPELFAQYSRLFADSRDVVGGHVETLVAQLAAILADGVRRGELACADPARAARALFDGTARFHHPAHAGEWRDPRIDEAFAAVFELLVDGLAPPRERGRPRAKRAQPAPRARR